MLSIDRKLEIISKVFSKKSALKLPKSIIESACVRISKEFQSIFTGFSYCVPFGASYDVVILKTSFVGFLYCYNYSQCLWKNYFLDWDEYEHSVNLSFIRVN